MEAGVRGTIRLSHATFPELVRDLIRAEFCAGLHPFASPYLGSTRHSPCREVDSRQFQKLTCIRLKQRFDLAAQFFVCAALLRHKRAPLFMFAFQRFVIDSFELPPLVWAHRDSSPTISLCNQALASRQSR